MNEWSQTIDFSPLLPYTKRYKTQTTINESRVHLYVAYLFFYKLHLPSVIRYLGVNYMGPYRNITSIQATTNAPKTFMNPSSVFSKQVTQTFSNPTLPAKTSSNIKLTVTTQVLFEIQKRLSKQ